MSDDAASDGGQRGARDAFVTLVTTESFVVGAKVLLYSLRAHMKVEKGKTAPEVVCLVTPNIPASKRTELGRLCDAVVEVEPISNPHSPHVQGWVDSGFTKLRIWELAMYRRVVFLDADALVMSDLQELFALDTTFAASPDVFPPDRFNAGKAVSRDALSSSAIPELQRMLGVLMVAPDKRVFEDLLSKISELGSYDGGDTGFLNHYFRDWYASGAASRLPFRYNAQRTMYWMTHEKNPGYWDAIKPLKVLHFSSSPKPWEECKKKGDLEMLWWENFVMMQLGQGPM